MSLPPALRESTLHFASADGLQLEGRLHLPDEDSGSLVTGRAVICHPHPLMGGTLDNKVVETIARALGQAGYATLRFNFRGVGTSEGDYGGGHDEVEDVVGALRHLDQVVGRGKRILAGFSFGSLMAAGALKAGECVDHLFLVGMPLNRWCFVPPLPDGGLTMIVGDHDEFCTAEKAREYIDGFADDRAELRLIAGATHFFHGQLQELAFAVTTGLAPC